MNATIVINSNFPLSAQALPTPLAVASFKNGVDILERLQAGIVETPYDYLWKGHNGSLMSYCLVMFDALRDKVALEDLMECKRRLNLLKVDTNDDAPMWTMDDNVLNQHKRYIESNDEALLTEF